MIGPSVRVSVVCPSVRGREETEDVKIEVPQKLKVPKERKGCRCGVGPDDEPESGPGTSDGRPEGLWTGPGKVRWKKYNVRLVENNVQSRFVQRGWTFYSTTKGSRVSFFGYPEVRRNV